MVGHADDLFMDTREMLDRIRPKQRHDLALVAIAAMLGIAIVWAAALLQLQPSPRHSFIPVGTIVFVGDNRTGAVAVCQMQEGRTVCSKNDSALQARTRRIEGDLPGFHKFTS